MPRFIQWFYPGRIWAFSRKENTVYLTFDDGPIPEVTPWVLDTLKDYSAKATFFCIGDNVEKHPEIFTRILTENHVAGNHTYNHLNGWKTNTIEYVQNVLECREIVDSELFRPPYGRLTSRQAKILRKKGFKIVMWEIISFDYDASVSEEKCLQNVLRNIKPGSIIVFHDSLKAEKNLRYVLPKVLEYISEKGWRCSSI